MTHGTGTDFDFDTPVDRRGTWSVQWDGLADRFPVADLLPFTISDMDFPVAPVIRDALAERLGHGVFGYSDWMHDDFLHAVRDWFSQQFDGAVVDPATVVYAPSVLSQVSQLVQMWTEPGDGVAVHTPTYDGFRKCVDGLGRELRRIPLGPGLTGRGGGDRVGLDALDRELSRPATKVLILCSPHNPTGTVWTAAELAAIGAIAARHGVPVISDEIHADLAHPGHPHVPWMMAAPEGGRWALVTSASKSFNFPALTGSYGILSDPADRAEFLRRMWTGEGLASPAVLSLTAHIAAYRGGAPWLSALREYVLGNLRLVADVLAADFPDLGWRPPEAGYLAWIDLRPLGVTEDAPLQHDLVHREKVAIMPGGTYGAEGIVRLNVGCPRAKAAAGADALVRSVRRLGTR
ncbi:MalY/PatB family protein [Streptomyces sp. NPDC060194]|uniref:MalY/PatB family protein n=1 Tax=Streptomyces sp. NPDC060194 TaxID=3347069 RepID=UPI00365DF978